MHSARPRKDMYTTQESLRIAPKLSDVGRASLSRIQTLSGLVLIMQNATRFAIPLSKWSISTIPITPSFRTMDVDHALDPSNELVE